MNLSMLLSVKVSLDLGDNVWLAVLYVLCGLGIFLYGIDMMGGSLKSLAGNKMKVIIEKSTNSPIKGLLVGFLITMLTQSASGTSALAVSLVAVGLMTFPQALGILLGANIGGTVLTIIMAGFQSINIMPVVSVILVALGAAMVFFFKKKKIKQVGSVILGFGLIFLGLTFISMSMKTIQNSYSTQIELLFSKLADLPVLGVIVGTLFTFVVQSSSATIGIVQEMYTSATIPLKGALAIMLGANIGTTITAFIASLGSSKAAKKVAVANILIKLIGVIVFMCAWLGYKNLVLWVNDLLFGTKNNSMIIALAHLFFNVVNSFVFLFLLKPLSIVCNKIIKGDDESDMERQLSDFTLVKKSPTLALEFAKTAIDYMGKLTVDFFELTEKYSFEHIPGAVEKAEAYEHEINGLDKKIHDYLVQIAAQDLTKEQTNMLSKYLDTIKDLERIGDHCSNIVEFFNQRYEAKLYLSKNGTEELHTMFEKLHEMVDNAYIAVRDWNLDAAQIVVDDEEYVDDMEEKYRKHHVERLTKGICSVSNLDYYVDILSNLERVGDHTHNIANNVINEDYLAGEIYNH
ncbi:MAG: Na/Pi cotransporter family protein [Anaeroplasmataceae bacterium]